MPPKKTSGTATKGKKASGDAQPTLSFKSRKASVPSPSKKKATGRTSSLRQSVSASGIRGSRSPSPEEPTTPTLGSKGDGIMVPQSDDDDDEVTLAGGGTPEKGGSKRLDVKSKKWNGVYQDAKVAMGNMQPIHAGPETHNNVHHILRVFDMTSKYGPCVGMTRLQRWERAKKWGLNPPEEIREILVTVEGKEDSSYRENVLHDWV